MGGIGTYLKICYYSGVLMESPSHSRKSKNISLIISGIFLCKENIYAKYNKFILSIRSVFELSTTV